jgi:macrodomain Ter protein organizer (MatP/YcbG family)
MGKSKNFKKEYVTGRKDQYDLDYTIFRKCVEKTNTREELIQLLDDKMKYVISKIGSERANELMEEMELL